MGTAPDLTGQSILIVENERGLFVASLQQSIEKRGAQCVVADSARWAAEILLRFRFSAIVINADRRLAQPYRVPTIVYHGRQLSDVRTIVDRLVRALR